MEACLLPDRKPVEQKSPRSSPRMVDHYKASRRAYNERKPTKTPKKETEGALCGQPDAVKYDQEPEQLGGGWCLTFTRLEQGRDQLCSQEGGAASRWVVLSPLLCLAVFSLLSWRPCPLLLFYLTLT